jgi:hypothetical protein
MRVVKDHLAAAWKVLEPIDLGREGAKGSHGADSIFEWRMSRKLGRLKVLGDCFGELFESSR